MSDTVRTVITAAAIRGFSPLLDEFSAEQLLSRDGPEPRRHEGGPASA